jgi:serine/threonine-protein kinase
MGKSVFTAVSILFWLVALFAVLMARGAIAAQFESEDGTALTAAYVVIGVGFLAGILANTMLGDKLFSASVMDGGMDKLSPEQRTKVVEAEVRAALAAGKVREAVVAYENGGMVERALSLAQEKGEHALAARLFLKVGRHDPARKAALKVGDHLMAAHLSLLLKDFSAARNYYGLYLDKAGASLKPAEKARFLDRAGRYAEAAAIYNEYGDFVRAGDAWALAQAHENAAAARSKASVLQAVEKGRENASSAGIKTRLMRDGDAAKAIGDLFAAAWAYHDAGSPLSAGEVFQSIEEWVRAASCFEAAGDHARARAMWEKAMSAPAQAAPPPQATPAPHPLASTSPAPQGGGHSGAFPTSGQSGAFPTGGVRSAGGPAASGPPPAFAVPASIAPGKVWKPLADQAAQPALVVPSSYIQSAGMRAAPTNAEGWRDMARALAMAGNLKGAADIHLQQGELGEAVACLADAGQPREAAMLALGGGDYAKAAELLVDQIDAGVRGDIGELLGQILMNLSEFELADQLLRRRLAPKFNEQTAPIIFQFARMFEEAGALVQAECLYEDLIKSGATSGELEACLRSVRRRLNADGDSAGSRTGTQPGLLTSQVRRKLNAWDFIQAAIADSDDSVPKPSKDQVEEKPAPAKPYAFTPPKSIPVETAPKTQQQILPSPPPKPRNQVSLLGSAGSSKETIPAGTSDPFNLAERYRLDREIGKGGMGVVYQAHDLLLDRQVALKLLHSFGANGDSLRQFLLEARAIARMNHQHVIRIFDMGVMDLKHYIAMEHVVGSDLKAHIMKTGKLPLREAMRLFVQMAEGLGAAHEAGIVHRDIKPGNVLLTEALDVRLVDFGLAKLEGVGGHQAEEQTIFRCAGTPGFMAPEQIRGESVGPPADIYALGITLFQMLAGAPPHRMVKLAGAEQISSFTLAGQLPSLQDHAQGIPPAIEQLYRYCTAVSVDGRFREVSAFLPTARQWAASL